jgi:SAM-dependent methyltransferase
MRGYCSLGIEIDLLVNYPKSNRQIAERAFAKTDNDRAIARQFGEEFFDGDRRHGYGGFSYHPRFWQPVVPTLVDYWGLGAGSSLLDVGCAKGFLLHDLQELVPGISVQGVDISDYAISHAKETVRDKVGLADAQQLPFASKSFDVVISINTLHNLDREGCIHALSEIERVARGHSFITVDAFRDDAEMKRMFDWNLTARTILSVEDWILLFGDAGYTGDYYWFTP